RPPMPPATAAKPSPTTISIASLGGGNPERCPGENLPLRRPPQPCTRPQDLQRDAFALQLAADGASNLSSQGCRAFVIDASPFPYAAVAKYVARSIPQKNYCSHVSLVYNFV